jgi:CheY-like chemotaxis protein
VPRTILLADDSVTIRKVVELTFRDTGIRVVSVASGRECLERFFALEPDLVLADVVMPEPTGYDVCRAVKESPRPVPVLLLAGTFEPFDGDRAASVAADGHVLKPFESRALVERVERLLGVHAAVPVPAAIPHGDPALAEVLDDLAAAEPAGGGEETPPQDPAAPSAALVEAVARAVVAHLSPEILREVAWDVVPDLAEIAVRERLRELEKDGQ